MTRRMVAAAGIGLLLVLVLAACRGAVTGGSQGLSLDGTWRLVSGTADGKALPLVAGRDVTLVVDGSKVSGRACNLYGGTITVSGQRVTLSELSMTEMACDEPLMTIESAYHAALLRVDSGSRSGDVLTLSGPQVELRFQRVAPVADAALVGMTWQLEALVAGQAASSTMGEPATLVLARDGTLSGSTGCRGFTAAYTLTGDRVTVSNLQADARLCTTELARQDEHVLGVLAGHFRATVTGQMLTLTADDGNGLIYRVPNPRGSAAPVASAVATPPIPSGTPPVASSSPRPPATPSPTIADPDPIDRAL